MPRYEHIKIFQTLKQLNLKSQRVLVLVCLVFGFSIFSLIWYVVATESTNIESEAKFAWSENGGWLNFGDVNSGVLVTDSDLTGYVWSENLGWISLNCSNDNSCTAVNYKIANDNEGNLSGYAWGENIGWVNFAPADGGVQIDSSGNFSGYAWGENIGWVIFNCQDVDACDSASFKVATTWLPLSARDDDEADEDAENEDVEISDVHFSATDSTVVINWKTNHSADSRVLWGENADLEEEKKESEKEREHRIVLRELDSDTQYYFRVKSVDGDGDSASSKIYKEKTKPTSDIFVSGPWQDFLKNEKPQEEAEYEKVDVTVTDKIETEAEKEEKQVPVEINKNAGKEAKDKPSFMAGIFSALGRGISGFFSGARELAFESQRKIGRFFDRAGEGIAESYHSLLAKLDKEKADEIAKIKQAKFFTTEVFNRQEKKILAEVRFQILDKKDDPIPNLDTMLFSDPQSAVTDENGVASFKDVPIGSHTLAFDYQNEKFEKKVAIADTLTDEGKVRAEVVQVWAEKEKIAFWMWTVIALLIFFIAVATYFAKKYYQLKKQRAV